MKKAIDMDSTVDRWLLAAAIDRDLMRRDKPQIYGTQYIKMGQDAKWERYKIDSTQVTDAERNYYGVETLTEQKEKERTLNLRSIVEFYSESKSFDKTLALIKAEMNKENAATYHVSEEEINSFGYELLNAKKADEALIIFTLNTEWYPNGFNTFDSLGECLLMLNKKTEGIKAYQKSLELNPKNEKARRIINEAKGIIERNGQKVSVLQRCRTDFLVTLRDEQTKVYIYAQRYAHILSLQNVTNPSPFLSGFCRIIYCQAFFSAVGAGRHHCRCC